MFRVIGVRIQDGEPSFVHPNSKALFLLTAAPDEFPPIPATFRSFLRLSVSLPLGNEHQGGARSTLGVEAERHVLTCEFSHFSS